MSAPRSRRDHARRFLAPVAASVLVTVAAACGGGGDGDDAAAPAEARPLPACAGARKPIERPSELPSDFPLPPGTVFQSSRRPYPGQLVLRGLVPTGLSAAATFFKDELPEGGYNLGRGDAERGEAEALFAGNGIRGGWRVNQIPACDNAVRLLLVIVKQQ